MSMGALMREPTALQTFHPCHKATLLPTKLVPPCQGVIMDFFRIPLRHGFKIAAFGEGTLLNSGNRLFLVSGCVTSAAGLLLSFCLASSDPWRAPEDKAHDAGTVEAGLSLGQLDEAAQSLLPHIAHDDAAAKVAEQPLSPQPSFTQRAAERLRGTKVRGVFCWGRSGCHVAMGFQVLGMNGS